MNYRHGFHAGNFADVLKHAVLAWCIHALARKDKPFVVLDLHAGRARYDLLLDDFANRTGEWHQGIARIWGAPDLPALLQPWMASVARLNVAEATPHLYPGSALLALMNLRAGDRLIANELHPEEHGALMRGLNDPRARVISTDAYQAVRALTPPAMRRGLLMLDPPFEQPGEFNRLVKAVRDGLKRWATGVYLLWYPIKDRAAVDSYRAAVATACGDVPALDLCLRVLPIRPDGPLGAIGLTIINPPYGLADAAQQAGPWLAERLWQGAGPVPADAFLGQWLVDSR